MKRIILSGYYGFKNAGDEAILAALIDNLKRVIKDIEIIVLSADPEWTENTYNVSSINRVGIRRLISYLKEADLLISGGGSLLQDVSSNRSIPYYLGVIVIAKLLKVPVFFCAQGVGPIKNPFNRKMIKNILNKLELITVRDKDSKNLLKSIGVKKKIYLTADPVFTLNKTNRSRIKEILKKEGIGCRAGILGVSLRPWQDNHYLKEIAKVLDQVKEVLGVKILFLPLHYPQDLEVSKEVEALMKEEVEIIEGSYTPKEILSLIGEVDMLLGVRLHSLIFASLNRVAIAGISYDPKIDSFLDQLDLSPIGTIEKLDSQQLLKQIVEIWEQKEDLIKRIDKKVKNLEGLAKQNIELSLRLLGD
ncbi:polysaccharide pyruvyl transferase CsaB [Orenia marismortui]|uniref:Polysaccharide pyruvyl transferase CsaB n=1 Tax=Orenia marismortui TaxID=46469 RepID=A0A4R8H5G9_9FIRM|nr:polysaccharide pyruvyl transferase CsaB [Orenia marismortui]TDX52459.1 polysaccharide pyruvyl transferase CsaB [Orenia marismortui]